MVIVPTFGTREQPPNQKVVAVNGEAYFAWVGRRCPCCGRDGLIGHGQRRRTYRVEPIPRGHGAPETLAYRVICKFCRHCHTVLPQALGPHKRYVLRVIECAVRAVDKGVPKARISAELGGVGPERIGCWSRHVTQRLKAVCRSVESLLLRDPLFVRPVFQPSASLWSYLQSLLGIGPSVAVLVALNLLLSANAPLLEPLLAHPPTSSGRPAHPCPTARAGGVPFG